MSSGLVVLVLVAFPFISPSLWAQDAQEKPDATEVNAEGKPDRPSDSPRASNYVLGPEDVVKIDVFDVPELSKTVRVSNDGMISLPLIGRVQAAGLTAEQLRQELEDKWGENYLQNPQVTVFVDEFKAKPVSVIGAVERPGLYPLAAQRTLIEVLSMAGGFGKKNTSPAGRTVMVTRRSGFQGLQPVAGMHIRGPDQIEIDLNRLLYTKDEALNIEIKPLDVVSVSRADAVYVSGAVKQPGGFVLEERPTITVLQAIALAQGLTMTASKKSARIIRTNEDGSKTEIPVDLGKVLRGKAPDTTLAANDILFVPDSKSKIVALQSTNVGVATFSGWLIWSR
jgi:polysaccharide export outer membrane protein